MYWDVGSFLEPNLLETDLLPPDELPAYFRNVLDDVSRIEELRRFREVNALRYRRIRGILPRLVARRKPTRAEIEAASEGGLDISFDDLIQHLELPPLVEYPRRRTESAAPGRPSIREKRARQIAARRLDLIKFEFLDVCQRHAVPTMLWPVIWRQMTIDPTRELDELVPRSLAENWHVMGMSTVGFLGIRWDQASGRFALLLLDLDTADDEDVKALVDGMRERAGSSHRTRVRDNKEHRVQRAVGRVIRALRTGKRQPGLCWDRRHEYVDAWNTFARHRKGHATEPVKYSVAEMYCYLYENRKRWQSVYEFVSEKTIRRVLRRIWEESTSHDEVTGFCDLFPPGPFSTTELEDFL